MNEEMLYDKTIEFLFAHFYREKRTVEFLENLLEENDIQLPAKQEVDITNKTLIEIGVDYAVDDVDIDDIPKEVVKKLIEEDAMKGVFNNTIISTRAEHKLILSNRRVISKYVNLR